MAASWTLSGTGFAQTPPPASAPSPQAQICQRLEAQLTAFDRGGNDSGRGEQVRRYEEASTRQQAELDRAMTQARRMGCENSGFAGFFGFNTAPAQCGPLNNQIQQMRNNLDRMMADLQRLQGSGADYEREGQRRALLAALGRNDCGPQYRAAAQVAQPPQSRGLFDTLFGGSDQGFTNPAQGAGYRTICVRTCDGYFFPISFAASQDRVRDDERQCQKLCPASEVTLYSYRNPGETVSQAVSASGRLYSELPNAFRYRQEYNPACSCKRPGESWADALKNLDDRSTIEQGDIIVTQERAKSMSQRDAQGRLLRPNSNNKGLSVETTSTPPAAAQAETAPAEPAPKKTIRAVGPPLLQNR